MAITLIGQAAAGSSDGNGVTTAGFDSTGGNLGIIAVASQNDTAANPTDNKSNTWTALTNQSVPPDMRLWYSTLTSVGSGHTASWSATGDVPAIQFFVFAGAATSSVTDGENGAQAGSGFSQATGSVGSFAQNGDLCFTGIAFDSAGTTGHSIDSSFTLASTFIDLVNGQHYAIHAAYKIKTDATAENPTWSWSTQTAGHATRIAAFKPGTTTHSLFRFNDPLNGIGSGGPFFKNPLG